MKRILIVTDHSLVVHAIRLALRQTAGFRVIGFFDGRQSVRSRLVELRPDVVLVDEMSDQDNALARVREVAEEVPSAKTLILTQRTDGDWLDEVFDAGADGVISKKVHAVALGTLLRETVVGNVIHRYRRTQPLDTDCPLTSREVEILSLAAQGYTNGRIAKELWVTEQTVKFHLSNTYRKLGVANRTEASRYAYMNSLVTPERLAS
jgi:DNA-binding NarL/FixJ family response regulator